MWSHTYVHIHTRAHATQSQSPPKKKQIHKTITVDDSSRPASSSSSGWWGSSEGSAPRLRRVLYRPLAVWRECGWEDRGAPIQKIDMLRIGGDAPPKSIRRADPIRPKTITNNNGNQTQVQLPYLDMMATYAQKALVLAHPRQVGGPARILSTHTRMYVLYRVQTLSNADTNIIATRSHQPHFKPPKPIN